MLHSEEQPRHSAGHKLCVIVPFRNGCGAFNQGGGRDQNLDEFLRHMPRFLDKAGVWSHRVIVAEQSQRGLFNKGVMFNVGVKHAEAIGCDYMVMNDVDQLPVDSRNTHEFPEDPIHLCSSTDQKDFKFYDRMVGGALLLTLKHFKEINGYSNEYFGWGQEDDDMYERIRFIFKRVRHLLPKVGKYHALSHGRVKDLDVSINFHKNSEQLKKIRKGGAKVVFLDGYNTIDSFHKIVAVAKGPFVEARREEAWKDMTVILDADYDHLLVDVLKNGSVLTPCDDPASSANSSVVGASLPARRHLY